MLENIKTGIVQRYENQIGSAIKFRAGFGFLPEGEPFEKAMAGLDPILIQRVFFDLGKDLSKLHKNVGEGYGSVRVAKLIFTGYLEASYQSWHQFLTEGFFDVQTKGMDDVFRREEQNEAYASPLNESQRAQLTQLWGKRPLVRKLLDDQKGMLEGTRPHVLNGNLHFGSIFVSNGRYSGLADFKQMVLGDPVNDLAYFSVMPGGEELLPIVRRGWEEVSFDPQIEEKLHLYRLLQAYRKIYRRYAKYHRLGDYPQPLRIAREELNYFEI